MPLWTCHLRGDPYVLVPWMCWKLTHFILLHQLQVDGRWIINITTYKAYHVYMSVPPLEEPK